MPALERVTAVEIRGGSVRLGFEVDRDVHITKQEIDDVIEYLPSS